jgi:O-antigen ligase
VAFLLVEFGRPMDWFPALAPLRPGLLVGAWGLATVLLRGGIRMPRPLGYMVAFCLLMVWHVPWATNNRWALWGLEDFATLLFGGIVPLMLLPTSLAQVRRLLYVYVLIHVVGALHALTHSGFGPGGWLWDENDLAFTLNAAMGIGVYLLIEAKTVASRLTLSAALAILAAGVAATNSRGGFVGFAVLGLYQLVFGPYRRGVAVCMVLAVCMLALFAPAGYWDEVRSIAGAAEKGDTGEQRLYFWSLGWKMFLDYPIAGVGTNNFGIRAPEYHDPTRTGWKQHPWGRAAHSLYFTLLPEHGLIGVALFGGMLVWCVRAARSLRRSWLGPPQRPDCRTVGLLASGLTAGLFAALATGAFLSVLYYPPTWVLPAFIGLLASTGTPRGPEAEPAPKATPARGWRGRFEPTPR